MKLVSVIIVDYQTKDLVDKLKASLDRVPELEVVVVNNTKNNRGFAKGCNLGARRASGQYLLFLNPDTWVSRPQGIKLMAKQLQKNSKIGILGPALVDQDNRPYLSATQQPGRLSALISFSIIDKWWPNNRWSKQFWYRGEPLVKARRVGSVSGAALMIAKDLFLSLGGFDEKFFMYWEDYDLCRRVEKAGYQVWLWPKMVVRHDRAGSTARLPLVERQQFFRSRIYFMAKHFGWFWSWLIEAFLRATEEWRLGLILLIAAGLRFYQLAELMPFIGDQGYDYLAALNGVKNDSWPLLGIPSSVPRFRQGPLYVWLLMVLIKWIGFDPVYGGIAAAVIGLLAVAMTYYLADKAFGRLAAVAAGLIMAVSPLAVTQSRLVFHTNAIPLMSAIYLANLWRPMRNHWDRWWLGVSFGLLFQFELATIPLVLLGFYKSIIGLKEALRRVGAVAVYGAGIALSLWPQLLYDLGHQGKQLGLFVVWLGYRVIAPFGLEAQHSIDGSRIGRVMSSLNHYGSRFLGGEGSGWWWGWLAVIGWWWWDCRVKKRKFRREIWLGSWLGLCGLGFLIQGSPSEAYYPMLFVPLAILIGWTVDGLSLTGKKWGLVWLGLTAIVSVRSIISHGFYMHQPNDSAIIERNYYGPPLGVQKQIVAFIRKKVGSGLIEVQATGPGSEFPSFVDNIRYLLAISQTRADVENERVWFLADELHQPPSPWLTTVYEWQGVWLAIERQK